jgi:hypothetical protein
MSIHWPRGRAAGLAVAALFWLAHLPAAAAPEQTPTPCDAKKGLVILAGFPDIAPPVQEDFVRGQFNKLSFYVREMSYGRVCVEVDVTGWHTLPHSIKAYAIPPANLAVDKSRVEKVVQDAIDAADGHRDFSRYSFVVLFLGASFQQYGMVGLAGYPGMLGWQREIVFRTKSGQVVPGGVAIFTYQAHLGTLFHDIAHVWGGVRGGKRVLPCLYDHDLQAKYPTHEGGFANALINMGFWDPMSCHLIRRNLPPPGMSSWSKLRLGWIAPEKVRTAEPKQVTDVVLGPLEDGSAETLAVRIPLTDSTFYLVENRQPIGSFDPYLPGRGVLIMYGDDAIAECRNGQSPVKLMNADPSRPHLQGAAFDLPDRAVFTDPRNGIDIRLIEKIGDAYKIRIARQK